MASSADPSRLLAFEQVQASSETSLLRVEVHMAKNGSETPVGVLVVDDGAVSHRFKPLPAPPVPSPSIRIAFAVPLELLERQRAMSLELADELLELPTPTESTGRPVDAWTPAPPPPEGPNRRLAGYELVARQSEQLLELESELRRVREQLETEGAARVAAESAVQNLRAELHQAQGVAEADARRLEDRCAELELHLAEAIRELEAVTSSDRETPAPANEAAPGTDRLAG
jgi:hypothetical protein